jgi:hypothetical protein
MKKILILLMLVISQYGYSQFNTESKEFNQREGETKEYQAVKEQLDKNVEFLILDIITTVNSSIVKSDMILENPKSPVGSSCPSISVLTFDAPSPFSFPRIIRSMFNDCLDSVIMDRRSGSIISMMTQERDVIKSKISVSFMNYFWNNIKVEGELYMVVDRIIDRVGKSSTLVYICDYKLILGVNGNMRYNYDGEEYPKSFRITR